MVDPNEILSEFLDQPAEIERLLVLLKKWVPGGDFNFVPEGDEQISLGTEPSVPPEIRAELVQKVAGEGEEVGIRLTDGSAAKLTVPEPVSRYNLAVLVRKRCLTAPGIIPAKTCPKGQQ